MATRKRIWISLGVVATFALAFIGISAYIREQLPKLGDEESVGSNLGVFLLVNINIVVLMVLAFLVTKNVVKLVLDRRRRILGARLRSRLVAAFVGLSLIPAGLLFLVAKGILETVLQSWFSPQIAASMESALRIARSHFDDTEADLYRSVHHMAGELEALLPLLTIDADGKPDRASLATIAELLHDKREEYGLFEFMLVLPNGEILSRDLGIESRRGDVAAPEPNLATLQRALTERVLVQPEESLNSQFLRAYMPITAPVERGYINTPAAHPSNAPPRWILVGTEWILPELDATLSRVIDVYDDYRQLLVFRRPLASSYMLTLLVVTMMIIFAAVWVGFYLAKGVSVPIQQLAGATLEVARGNLDVRIPELGDDELGVLVHSFNSMIEDLKATTGELVERRQYIEAVLESVGVGVISVDSDARVTTLNLVVAEILAIPHPRDLIGKTVSALMPAVVGERIAEMLHELFESPEKMLRTTLSLTLGREAKQIDITVNKLVDEVGAGLGAVVVIDDLTELISAQRMAAWREVARRIAHEIKNPLTPIQLSAQRIQRRFSRAFGESVDDQETHDLVNGCAETIVNQVETLRQLVNEFSRFARMPRVMPRPIQLNELVQEQWRIFREANTDVVVDIVLDPELPILQLDREQMGRVLVNLLDNAIASVRARRERDGAQCIPRVVMHTVFDPTLDLVSLEVQDNGLGIPDSEKPRLFEPYFSRKHGGTGLGLAIVNTIVADHNGFVRVRDCTGGGASFVIELPVVGRQRGFTNV